MKSHWLLISLTALVSAILFDTMFHHFPSFLPAFAVNLIAVGFMIWAGKKFLAKNERPGKLMWVWIIITPLISIWLMIRGSESLQLLDMVTVLLLITIATINFNRASIKKLDFRPLFFLRFITQIFEKWTEPLAGLFKHTTSTVKTKSNTWVWGVFVGIPLVIIIGSLLSQADLVFAKLLSGVFDWVNWRTWWNLLGHIWIVLYFIVFLGFYNRFTRKDSSTDTETGVELTNARRQVIEVGTLIGVMVGILLAVFLVVQVRYFVDDGNLVEQLGISYKEYTHQGFNQLVAVAIIAFLITWQISYTKRTDKRRGLWVAVVLIAETILILFSSLQRLLLYIDTYQWADKRFFLFDGMIYFFILLGLYLAFLLLPKFTRRVFIYVAVSAFVLNTLIVNVINPNLFMARHNVQAYIDGAEEYQMDYDYASYIGPDSAGESLRLYDAARTAKEKTRTAGAIVRNWDYLQRAELNTWYGYNAAEISARNTLKPRIDEIKDCYEQHRDIECLWDDSCPIPVLPD